MQVFPKWHDIFHELLNPTSLTTVLRFCLDHMHTLRSDDLALNCICLYLLSTYIRSLEGGCACCLAYSMRTDLQAQHSPGNVALHEVSSGLMRPQA